MKNSKNFLISLLVFIGLGFGNLCMADEKVFRLPMSKPAGNLNPIAYKGLWVVQDMVFEGLVKYTRGGVLEPVLAKSWTQSNQGKTITFKLRENVFFTDGTPWNAEVMTWNIDRWIDEKPGSWLQLHQQFDRFEIVDPMTVSIHLKNKIQVWLIELSYIRPVRFMSPKAVDADGKYTKPVGTGKWIVESDSVAKTVLVRNENYWGKKPKIDKVELFVIPNQRSRGSALQAGEIDASGGKFIAAVSPQQAEILKKKPGITVVSDVGTDTMVLGFNPRREIFKDVRVREAVNVLISRQAIATGLLRGYATPTMNLYPEVIAYSGKRWPVPARDVDKAKKLLADAGWTKNSEGVLSKNGKPFEIELVLSEDAVAGSRKLGEVLQYMLSEAGIVMSLRNVDHAARHGEIPKFKYDLSLFMSNGAPYDPFNTITMMFPTEKKPGTDGKMYESKELDPLIWAAARADEPDRVRKFQKVWDWLYENHAIAPLYHEARIWAYNNEKVKSFSIAPTEYEMPLEGLSFKH